jgi:hypothetical protein
MSFDLLDATFLKHAVAPVEASTGPVRPEANDASDRIAAAEADGVSLLVTDGVLAQLLKAYPDQWWALVDRVTKARQSGIRSIAVAGHHAREGRSTLIHGLKLMLSQLDYSVRSYETSCEWWQELVGDAERWQWHQGQAAKKNEIALVDAGIWFLPGRLRLQPLRLASFGFDAVIVVRRQEAPSCSAYVDALAQLGVNVLGEVVCFAPVASGRAA